MIGHASELLIHLTRLIREAARQRVFGRDAESDLGGHNDGGCLPLTEHFTKLRRFICNMTACMEEIAEPECQAIQ